MAVVQFCLALFLWVLLLGWIIHAWSTIDAVLFRPESSGASKSGDAPGMVAPGTHSSSAPVSTPKENTDSRKSDWRREESVVAIAEVIEGIQTGDYMDAQESLRELERLDAAFARKFLMELESGGVQIPEENEWVTVEPGQLRLSAPARKDFVKCAAGAVENNRRARAVELYEEGQRLFAAGGGENKKRGLEVMNSAREVDPSYLEPVLAVARAFYHLDPIKNSELVLGLAKHALTLEPENPSVKNLASAAYFERAQALVQGKEWNSAVEHMRRANELEPFDSRLLSLLRYATGEAKEHHAFVDICSAHLKLHPEDMSMHYALGRTLLDSARDMDTAPPDKQPIRNHLLQQAEDEFRIFLAANPLQADANFFFAATLAMQNQYDAARQVAAKLSEIDSVEARRLDATLSSGPSLYEVDEIFGGNVERDGAR